MLENRTFENFDEIKASMIFILFVISFNHRSLLFLRCLDYELYRFLVVDILIDWKFTYLEFYYNLRFGNFICQLLD